MLITLLLPASRAFQLFPTLHHQSYQTRTSQMARRLAPFVDPAEFLHHSSSLTHHDTLSWKAILSTMYTTTVNHGGNTIVSDLKNMATGADIAETKQLPEVAQKAIHEGWSFIDGREFKIVPTTAGFSETRGILPGASSMNLPTGTPSSLYRETKSTAAFLNVLDKLPNAAFLYVLIDFFLLRPGIDLYKEDIEDEPTDALAETLAVTTVRIGVFIVISFLTVTIFDRL